MRRSDLSAAFSAHGLPSDRLYLRHRSYSPVTKDWMSASYIPAFTQFSELLGYTDDAEEQADIYAMRLYRQTVSMASHLAFGCCWGAAGGNICATADGFFLFNPRKFAISSMPDDYLQSARFVII